MFDDVERGCVLEQPAREDLVPGQLLGRGAPFFDENLNEGAFFLRPLPRKRLLTSCNLDHKIAQAARLARLHHQVLREVVTLIEDADRDHAVLVGCTDLRTARGLRRPRLHPGDRIGDAGVLCFRRGFTAAAGREDRQQREC
ncbi:hypothetical protein V474_00405 [Novosphingobium barchaimii LL02]|uniref:Uncharacterized protein n=1 Tax=Novosphingobium barchaimii LL02 TaxID=1114963 RepID=A0A0J7YA11_9SPHN|nr:hypothetical protein V474_00405 [Novosphingobium barchaimii LL02]